MIECSLGRQMFRCRVLPPSWGSPQVLSRAVIVPPELKLTFEKNDLNFEYEIRAGTTEGEYTVTLLGEAAAAGRSQ